MQDLIIRPTAKFLKAGFVLCGLIVLVLDVLYFTQWRDAAPAWVAIIPLVILAWPGSRWLRRGFTTTTITGDRLRHETGFTSRMTRNLQLSKVQDVRIDQSVIQRMFDIGDLSIETAGETSQLRLVNVDSPHRLTDEIMARVQKSATS